LLESVMVFLLDSLFVFFLCLISSIILSALSLSLLMRWC